MDSIETADKLQPSDSVKINKQRRQERKKRWFPVADKPEVSSEKMFLAYSSSVEGASNSNSDRLACYPHTTARKTLPRQRRCVPVVSTGGRQSHHVLSVLPYAAARKSKNKTWNITGYSYRSRKLLLCLQDFLKRSI